MIGHAGQPIDDLWIEPADVEANDGAVAAIREADARPGGASPTLHYHRGLALRALGRDDDAAAAFQHALGQGDFPEAEDARQQLEASRDPGAEARRAG